MAGLDKNLLEAQAQQLSGLGFDPFSILAGPVLGFAGRFFESKDVKKQAQTAAQQIAAQKQLAVTQKDLALEQQQFYAKSGIVAAAVVIGGIFILGAVRKR